LESGKEFGGRKKVFYFVFLSEKPSPPKLLDLWTKIIIGTFG
jgi:hypothetical protein